MNCYRWKLATLLAAVLTLGCDSEPGGPGGGVPSFATHPTLADRDSIALTGQPFAAAVSPFNVVYVTRLSVDSLAKAALSTMSFSSIAIGDVPSQVRISPNGQTAYVNNQGGATSFVKFVRVSDNVVIDTATVPGAVLTLGLAPNGAKLYALTDFKGVYVIDPFNGTKTDSISPATTDSLLTGVAFHPYMLRMYIAARDKGEVSTVNTEMDSVISSISVSGARIQNLAVSRDGAKLYGTDIQRSKLITWNLSNGIPVASPTETDVGTVNTNNNAFDVAITPDNVQIYVTTLVDGKLFVFTRDPISAVTNINLHGKPRYIAFDYPGNTAVIPNENGWVDFIR